MTIREIAESHPRCFWLDGGGAQEWAGTTSLIGWLEESDPSLTYSAARREVTVHQDGASTVIGSDIFEVLDTYVAEGGQWFGYFGYASRADLPARPSVDVPDAVWMRPSHVRRSSPANPPAEGPPGA
ncbi:MAG TPA: anthranilate synthase component I family protein, partial [Nocardioides sp.]|nr:anthranilate synthase component I family protein [Nocardioides sp.]